MAFQRPNLSEIIERISLDIASRLDQQYPFSGSVEQIFAAALGAASHMLHGHLDFGIRQMLPTTAEGEYLDEHARLWLRQPRKAAAFAGGRVALQVLQPAWIPAGTVLRSSSGALYETVGELAAETGTVTLEIVAQEAGATGNLAAGSVLTLFSPILGVNSNGTVKGEISGGVNAETDDELRSRLLERIKNPPQGGSAADYRQWTLELSGFTRAWVKANTGQNSVTVFAVRDNDTNIIPNQRELDKLKKHLDVLKPVTTQLYVAAPGQKRVNYRIALSPDSSAARAAVEQALRDFHSREADLGGALPLSRISEAISLASGEYSHRLIEPAADVQAGLNELAVLGAIAWVS